MFLSLENISDISDRTGKPDDDVHKRHKPHKKINVMKDIDSVHSNVQSARQEALLIVFDDNDAVIKMIMKGRNPTMRHVSRTHRVALDWLFHRINLDSKIQIKYIDTKKQLADILTKGNFTRDEWNHLLSLCNISHFSSTICFAAMAKRFQQDLGEERVTAKSKLMMNLIVRTLSVVSSSTSLVWGRDITVNKILGNPVVADDRSGQLDKLSSTDHFKIGLRPCLVFSRVEVRYRRTIDQGNLIKLLGVWYNKFDLITEKLFSTELGNP